MNSDANPLKLEEDDWKILCNILHKYHAQFYAYGSRVKGGHRKFSDIDLCYDGKITFHERLKLANELAESNLGVSVDISDIVKLNPEFKKLIQKDLILLQI